MLPDGFIEAFDALPANLVGDIRSRVVSELSLTWYLHFEFIDGVVTEIHISGRNSLFDTNFVIDDLYDVAWDNLEQLGLVTSHVKVVVHTTYWESFHFYNIDTGAEDIGDRLQDVPWDGFLQPIDDALLELGFINIVYTREP